MEKKRIGILCHEGVTALDVVGSVDAFTTAVVEDNRGRREDGTGARRFTVTVEIAMVR